mmetsp:Transcript_12154/g.36624  ORF Transcript_12154/g.36624 Transcript_12154/m.36624 type:complete len:307 (-) Transcript_12154:446-1366(-)
MVPGRLRYARHLPKSDALTKPPAVSAARAVAFGAHDASGGSNLPTCRASKRSGRVFVKRASAAPGAAHVAQGPRQKSDGSRFAKSADRPWTPARRSASNAARETPRSGPRRGAGTRSPGAAYESFAKTVVGAASSATTPCAKATPSLMPVWATRTASPARLGSARNGVVAKTFPKTAKTALSRNSGEKSRAAISAASVMSSRFGMSFKDRLSTASTRRRNAPRVSVRDDGPCKAAYSRPGAQARAAATGASGPRPPLNASQSVRPSVLTCVQSSWSTLLTTSTSSNAPHASAPLATSKTSAAVRRS